MARGQAAERSDTVDSDESPSVLGRGTRVRGHVAGEGDLRIEGQVEGEVSISGDLAIEDGGVLIGDLTAGAVVIAGELKGDVTARGSVTIHATAKVEGNMAAVEVNIEEGASFSGQIEAEFDLPAELLPRQGR
jgi:cytoskeletal protein CcmA (bactofilin family)